MADEKVSACMGTCPAKITELERRVGDVERDVTRITTLIGESSEDGVRKDIRELASAIKETNVTLASLEKNAAVAQYKLGVVWSLMVGAAVFIAEKLPDILNKAN
jgi:hypothetical protein